jgi:signal transduction histidine kinase
MLGLDRPARRFDVVLCLAILLIALPATLRSDVGGDAFLDTLLLPIMLVPLALRRRSPLLAAVVFVVACVLSGAPTFDQIRIPAVVPVAMLIAFSLGRAAEGRDVGVGLALIFAGLLVDAATEHVVTSPLTELAFGGPLSISAFGAGRLVRTRDRLTAELHETTRALEERREATANLAVELERARLASDLDAAARLRVREIVDIAGAEREDPEAARAAFAAIERLGRDSLNDMRELLGVLRSDERPRRAPGPTLSELDGLLDDVRRGGRLVELDVQGDRAALPTNVELAAYRTLQHALVALRSENDAPLTIVLRYRPDHLEVEVSGVPVAGAGATAAIAAAQERVRAQGGSFDSGPFAARHVLRARLPLVAAHA